MLWMSWDKQIEFARCRVSDCFHRHRYHRHVRRAVVRTARDVRGVAHRRRRSSRGGNPHALGFKDARDDLRWHTFWRGDSAFQLASVVAENKVPIEYTTVEMQNTLRNLLAFGSVLGAWPFEYPAGCPGSFGDCVGRTNECAVAPCNSAIVR